MKISKSELAELIPQKSKMRLIEKIVDCDLENWTVESKTVISRNCIFFDEKSGGVPNYVLFEFAAQTVAALMGIKAREENSSFSSGFILSVSSFSFEKEILEEDAEIFVKTVRESEVGNVNSFVAEFFIQSNDEKIKFGTGKLTAMQGN